MKRNTLLFGAVALIFALAGIYFGARHHAPAATDTETTATAVDAFFRQHLSTPDGQIQSLAEWRGKALVVNFWATWCAPCVEEMPELVQLQAELAPDHIHVLGIGIDSADNIKAFAAKYHISYPLYVGGVSATEIARKFGNQSGGLPFTVLIDAKGTVRKTYLGRLKMTQLRADIAAL
jgi:thiol-disulfide isomerase/thioredoxin